MKTINVQNPKKQKSKRYLLFTALILVVCGLMIFNAFSNNKNLNEESFDSTKGIVETFEVKENEYVFNIKDLKDKGMWFVCADMDGTPMYDLNLTGSIGLVIGNEGDGVSKLVKENCDMIATIPMKGDIDSLNASVATGVLAYEIVRQRLGK